MVIDFTRDSQFPLQKVLLSMFLRELHVFTINHHDSQGLESQSITKHVFM